MNHNAKMLMRSAGVACAVGLVVSLALGYSGNARLVSVGNTLFAFAILGTLVLVVAEVVIWLIKMGTEARTRGNHRA
jgi:hypothetical protein